MYYTLSLHARAHTECHHRVSHWHASHLLQRAVKVVIGSEERAAIKRRYVQRRLLHTELSGVRLQGSNATFFLTGRVQEGYAVQIAGK